jgi:hypothetical protein
MSDVVRDEVRSLNDAASSGAMASFRRRAAQKHATQVAIVDSREVVRG